MDNTTDSNSGVKSALELEAERLFPYPISRCPWLRKKIDWKRENWVKSQEENLHETPKS